MSVSGADSSTGTLNVRATRRTPFHFSIVLIGVGLWIRVGVLATTLFKRSVEDREIGKAPGIKVIRQQPREIFQSASPRIGEQALFYIFAVLVFSFETTMLEMAPEPLLSTVLSASCMSFISLPLSSDLSASAGRRTNGPIGTCHSLCFVAGYIAFCSVVGLASGAQYRITPAKDMSLENESIRQWTV